MDILRIYMWFFSRMFNIKALKNNYMKQKLLGLHTSEFIHELDKAGMDSVNNIPGFESISKFIIENSVEAYYNILLRGSAIQLTESNSPYVNRIFQEVAETLDYKQELPDIYLKRGYNFSNKIQGYKHPLVILDTNCVEQLDENQLKFIVGRCIGGIMAGHNKFEFFAWMINSIGNSILPVISSLATLPIGQWQRKSFLTRDRAGLLACQNIESAIQVMMLTSGVPYGSEKEIDYYEYLNQAIAFQKAKGLEKFGQVTMTLGNDEAWIVDRAAELFRWYDIGEYDTIIMNH